MNIKQEFIKNEVSGDVYLPLHIDAAGNQYLKTQANMTKYGETNVEEMLNRLDASCFYLQEGYTKTAKGLIKVPDLTDPKDVKYSGIYTCDWLKDAIPMVSNQAILQVRMLDSYTRVLELEYPIYGTVFRREYNSNNGEWSDWKLTSGEVLLWSGNAGNGTVINIDKDIRSYGNLIIYFGTEDNVIVGNRGSVLSIYGGGYSTTQEKSYIYTGRLDVGSDDKSLTPQYLVSQWISSSGIVSGVPEINKIIGKP